MENSSAKPGNIKEGNILKLELDGEKNQLSI